jgi:hypothetical protein
MPGRQTFEFPARGRQSFATGDAIEGAVHVSLRLAKGTEVLFVMPAADAERMAAAMGKAAAFVRQETARLPATAEGAAA